MLGDIVLVAPGADRDPLLGPELLVGLDQMRIVAVRAGGRPFLRMDGPSIGVINFFVALQADRVFDLLPRTMAVEAPDPFQPVNGLAKSGEGRKLRNENFWS